MRRPNAAVVTLLAALLAANCMDQEPLSPFPPLGPQVTTMHPSAARSRIAFQSNRDGNLEIYAMNPDGTGQTRLSNDPGVDADPSWSPDGQRIVFRRDSGLWIMAADGSSRSQLTDHPTDRDPDWSPNGRKIAFVSSRDADRNPEIFVVNLDGTGMTQLTFTGSLSHSSPSWSVDGNQIVYSLGTPTGTGIYVMGSDGSGAGFNWLAWGIEPTWSPGGTQIAFVCIQEPRDPSQPQLPARREICVMAPDGSGLAQLTTSPPFAFEPSWSRDGTFIAFTLRDSFQAPGNVYVVAAHGSGQTPIAPSLAGESNENPGWSPSLDGPGGEPQDGDDFNRPDENPLGGRWTRGGGTFTDLQIVSHAVQGVSATGRGVAYSRFPWPRDQWSEVTVASLIPARNGGPSVRISATSQSAYVFAVGSGGYYIGKRVNGVWTELANGAHSFAVGDRLRLEASGDTLRAFKNFILVRSVLDASISSGNAGIWIYQNDPGLRFDNWAAGSHAPDAPTNLTATAISPSQINLSWTDTETNDHAIQIFRCTGADCRGLGEHAVVEPSEGFQDTGLTASTTYKYQVQAYNVAGTSNYSNIATATTPAPPPPSTDGPLATDAFDRPDENPLRGNWARGGGTFTDVQIVDNAVQGVTAGSRGVAYYQAVNWPADQWSEVRVLGLTSSPNGGPSVRILATSQTAYVFAVANWGYLIGKRVDGVWTELASGSQSFAVGDLLRLEVQGDTLRAFQNGTLVRSVLDSSIPSGSAGIWIYHNDPALRFDDWAGGSAEAATPYERVDLGGLGGAFGVARSVNNQGQVVGESQTAVGATHAFLWENGRMTDLGTLGGDFSTAEGVSEGGHVVGFSATATGSVHAYAWFGVMYDLGPAQYGGGYCCGPGLPSKGVFVNSAGHVTWTGVTGTGERRAFVWSGGAARDLGTLGGVTSVAAAINELGHVVGYSTNAAGESRAFLWDGNAMLDLGPGVAVDVNDVDQVTGIRKDDPPDEFNPWRDVAWLWDRGQTVDLGSLPGRPHTRPVAINGHGQVAGEAKSDLVQDGGMPWLWEGGVMRALDGNGGQYVLAMNAHGLVAGYCYCLYRKARVWENGVTWDLGDSTPEDRESWAEAVNDGGDVVGQNGGRAVLWRRTVTQSASRQD